MFDMIYPYYITWRIINSRTMYRMCNIIWAALALSNIPNEKRWTAEYPLIIIFQVFNFDQSEIGGIDVID